MRTQLDQLLESIHPARIADAVLLRADEALITFRIRANIVTDAVVYRDLVCRFLQHLLHHLEMFPREVTLPSDELWRRAVELLRSSYGPHGEIAAFDIARSGAEGGLYAVLKDVAVGAARQRAEKEVEQRVDDFCQRLSAEDYLAAGREYVEKHGRFLPPEMAADSAARARLNLAELLKKHPRALTEFRNLGRR